MKYSQAVITGSLSWDIIMDFPNRFVNYLQPDKLHQINVSFVVDNLEKQMGGTATNIAYALSQALKVVNADKPVSILGALGKDGEPHLEFFRKNGIDTRGILMDKKRYSASGTVITDLSDNQIWGFYYGACEKGKEVKFNQHVKKDALMIISANHPEAFLAAQKFAITNGIPYLYDVGMALSWIKLEDLKAGVAHAKYLVGNDYEISLITKTMKTSVEDLVQSGVDVVTTLGDKGVNLNFAADSATALLPAGARETARRRVPLRPRHLLQNKFIPAYILKKTIDPTGAGDAWRGGFMAGLLAGKTVEESLAMGNATASFAVESYGTVNYRMTKMEFNKRLKAITISKK